MVTRRTDDHGLTGQTETALRVIARRLREIMSEPGDGQQRLDKIVRQISGLMVAEVCSIYFKRQDGTLITPGESRKSVGGARAHERLLDPVEQLGLAHARVLGPEGDIALHNWVETSFAIGIVPLCAACSALFDKHHRKLVVLFATLALLAFGFATGGQPWLSIARMRPS